MRECEREKTSREAENRERETMQIRTMQMHKAESDACRNPGAGVRGGRRDKHTMGFATRVQPQAISRRQCGSARRHRAADQTKISPLASRAGVPVPPPSVHGV